MKKTKFKLSRSQKEKVIRALENHDKHKNAYFWTNNGNASERAYKEKQNSFSVQFVNNGVSYKYESEVTISVKNYYYSGSFYVNDEKKTRAAFARLLK